MKTQLSLPRRRAFTLVEMLLVLGVIAVFASLTLPSVFRLASNQKLTDAGERVREAIASARFRAIESGLIYQFCTESGGTNFVVVPYELDHLNSSSTGQPTANLMSRMAGILPKGLVFSSSVLGLMGVATPTGTSNKIATTYLDGLPNAGTLSGLSWSSPVLFHPNGTASSDAEITIKDPRGQIIKLRIRAFTGAVAMDRVTTEKR